VSRAAWWPVLLALAMSGCATASKQPDWRGIWIGEGLDAGISGFPASGARNYKLLPPFAPWNDAGRQRLAEVQKTAGKRKAPGWGYPMMMSSAAPMQFVVTPEETLIVNMYREVRHIHTDGRPLPPEEDRWSTVWGESIGRWEGDTLVIETVSVSNPNDYFFSAPPLSEQARYVERIRRVGKDRIENDMTITDPATLARPWVVKIAYVRAEGIDRLVHGDADNDRSEVEGDTFTILPPKD
jgi:hypothetical protein